MDLVSSDVAIIGAVLAALAIGQSGLTVSLLAIRKDPRGIYRPLLVFFVASAIAKFFAVTEHLSVTREMLSIRHLIDLISILAHTLIPPTLWIYVRALTSESPLSIRRADLWHLSAFFVGLFVSVMLLISPPEVRQQVIGDGEGPETPQVVLLSLGVLALLFTWITQAFVYFVKILLRLMRYRIRLKDFFASTEGRELQWISWVVILLGINIFTVVCDMFLEVSPRLSLVSDVFYVAIVWVLSAWGLRAQPPIQTDNMSGSNEHVSSSIDAEASSEARSPKYEKSPLTPEHMARISEKLESVMKQEKPYLEPSLSLGGLAKAISTPPNYLSQTLNSRIGETFFDYVNAWRIKEAIPIIVGTEESIQNIVYDVGFNSRSAFYKAFKRETNMTPRAYRTKHSEDMTSS